MAALLLIVPVLAILIPNLRTARQRSRQKRTLADMRVIAEQVDGRFMQWPEGICYDDRQGQGPLGDCMSCHPSRVAKAVGSTGHGTRQAHDSHR